MIGRWLWILGAAALAFPWMVLRVAGYQGPPLVEATLSGLAIVGAAFLLSWGAEVAQIDIPPALAIAFLALVAVLPEYAVDVYLAWKAGKDPTYTHYALANMTGANRLLIGLGWSAVVILYWLKFRKPEVTLEKGTSLELSFLGLATLYSFLIPLKRTLSLLDAVVLLGLFCLYMIQASRHPVVEPELEGPAEAVAVLPRLARRMVTVGLFVFAGCAILASAEPFAEGLITLGRQIHLDEFLLVQWLAPLASEFPEFLVAVLYALKGAARVGLGTLISSKVNQWTMLVGILPVVFAFSRGALVALPLDARQQEEMFLTAAQSAFAIAILADYRINVWEALALAILFLTQLVFPGTAVRIAFAWIYLVLALLVVASNREKLGYFRSLLKVGQVPESGAAPGPEPGPSGSERP